MNEIILTELAEIKSLTLLAAKKMLTLDDAAKLTGISKSTLYKLTCTNQIPYYRPRGKYIYFDRAELEDWMRQNRSITTTEAEQQAAAYIAEKGGAA